MNEFKAYLMPSSLQRRWSYNELIPALLYFDRVTFPMDDIEPQYVSDEYRSPGTPPVRLRSPNELEGMEANEFVDGLTVEQHRYYWPMRDLMAEEVICISAIDLFLDKPGYEQTLRQLLRENDPLAHEYLNAASGYYDFMVEEQNTLSRFEKALKVRDWIKGALSLQRKGWEQVTIHPAGYVALLSALKLFPDLFQLSLESKVDRSGHVRRSAAASYLAPRTVGTILQSELDSLTLEGDSEALSEILEVRQKYASELQEFRIKMIEAVKDWRLAEMDLSHVPDAVDDYIYTVQPTFAQTRRALSDKLRVPKLIFEKGGAVFMSAVGVGVGAYTGTMAAGPIGTVAGAAFGATTAEALKSFFGDLGKKLSEEFGANKVSIDKSMVYLFHAQKALRR